MVISYSIHLHNVNQNIQIICVEAHTSFRSFEKGFEDDENCAKELKVFGVGVAILIQEKETNLRGGREAGGVGWP